MNIRFPDVPQSDGWPWRYSIASLPETRQGGSWPRITVVTPSFNQAQFLEETIRSVLLQNYSNLEYIIMDGGSADGSIDIIRKYEPWLTYWESKQDRGQSHAINKGFATSTGQIMTWLNSDDVLAPGALSNVAQIVRDKRRALLVGASIITRSESELDGKLDQRRPSWPEILYDFQSFPQPSVFWTRDLWKLAGPLDEQLHFVMDYDLWLRMHPHIQELTFTETVLSYARSHDGQKSAGTGAGLFEQQRAQVAIRAAKSRGEHPYLWLAKTWLRRFSRAFRTGNRSLLKGSASHRAALRCALRAL